MRVFRLSIIGTAAAAAALLSLSTSAGAWNYGDSWVIPLDPQKSQNGLSGLPGPGWNFEATGGYGGGGYYWADGFDSIRQARWFFDASVTGGDAPTTAEKFLVETWVPAEHANVYSVIEVSFDGLGDEGGTNNPNIPWAGQYGTNHQWLDRHQANQGGFVQAGPGPQSPGVWNGIGYVYAKQGSYFWMSGGMGFYKPGDQYAVSAIRLTVVPEPASALALGGGLLSMTGLVIRRRK
ncbi:MAG: PEP-CTERM sorting domain-containing protein [Armatimonadetes bacterium]|nr:PEP-CTERM sorting domain-containing protein [Armatimonadota bacterium]